MATAIIQARMGSTRLPGKIFADILGVSAFQHQIERLRQSGKISRFIVATTHLPGDDQVEAFCFERNIECFRGDSDDVLSRYLGVIEHFHVGGDIVRITADCPLIDATIIDSVIGEYEKGGFDYISNAHVRSFPIGMDAEVFSVEALVRASEMTSFESGWREHVTPAFYKTSGVFKVGAVIHKPDLSSIRLTLDTPEDLIVIRKIYENLFPTMGITFGLKDILQFLERNPQVLELNSHVQQKCVDRAKS